MLKNRVFEQQLSASDQWEVLQHLFLLKPEFLEQHFGSRTDKNSLLHLLDRFMTFYVL
jgi:hypothetical protein